MTLNELYLFHTLRERDCINVIRIDQYFIKKSWLVLSIKGKMMHYFTPVQNMNNGQIYYSYTTTGEKYNGIAFSHHYLRYFSDIEVQKKIKQLHELAETMKITE